MCVRWWGYSTGWGSASSSLCPRALWLGEWHIKSAHQAAGEVREVESSSPSTLSGRPLEYVRPWPALCNASSLRSSEDSGLQVSPGPLGVGGMEPYLLRFGDGRSSCPFCGLYHPTSPRHSSRLLRPPMVPSGKDILEGDPLLLPALFTPSSPSQCLSEASSHLGCLTLRILHVLAKRKSHFTVYADARSTTVT